MTLRRRQQELLRRVHEAVAAAEDPAKLTALRGRLNDPRALAWVAGTVRHRRTLRQIVGALVRRAFKGKDRARAAALELLAFRLLFSAAGRDELEEELAVLAPSRRQAEPLERALDLLEAAVAGREGPHEGADDVLPLDRGRSIHFHEPVLGLAGRTLATQLGLLHSLPDELVATWLDELGEEQTRELCRAMNDPPPMFVRAHPLRTDPTRLAAELAEEGVELVPADPALPLALRVASGRDRLRRTQPWSQGELTIQDLTAQRAAPLLDPQPGERVLDLCSAPGTKASGLAELARDEARVVACDLRGARLRKVGEVAERLGLSSLETRKLDASQADLVREVLADVAPFDAVLVDAPCSNTGVLRRRPEARWRYDKRGQRRLVALQGRILEAAVPLVRPGGRLLYSLCSIEADEGPEQVQRFLAQHPEFELAVEQRHYPSPAGGDGGYLGLLVNRS